MITGMKHMVTTGSNGGCGLMSADPRRIQGDLGLLPLLTSGFQFDLADFTQRNIAGLALPRSCAERQSREKHAQRSRLHARASVRSTPAGRLAAPPAAVQTIALGSSKTAQERPEEQLPAPPSFAAGGSPSASRKPSRVAGASLFDGR
ncbi:hypothetical protein [Bradyrhizobium centrosematis]|uniref:hypothetical protein n=1 Tax=Bradyrhizobium centrosematis TaxID=1300039 RepID=UPI00388D0C4E